MSKQHRSYKYLVYFKGEEKGKYFYSQKNAKPTQLFERRQLERLYMWLKNQCVMRVIASATIYDNNTGNVFMKWEDLKKYL